MSSEEDKTSLVVLVPVLVGVRSLLERADSIWDDT